MDEIHFAPPKKPWNDSIPQRKYQQTLSGFCHGSRSRGSGPGVQVALSANRVVSLPHPKSAYGRVTALGASPFGLKRSRTTTAHFEGPFQKEDTAIRGRKKRRTKKRG